MNIISITPEQAWQMTLDQLRLEMPKADFDTWVGSAHFVAFGDGVITVGIPNAYGRDWLASRLTSTVNRLLTGILDQPVGVQFTVMEEVSEVQREAILNEEAPVPEQHPKVLSLQAEYQSIYDEIVHPDQVIVVPGYFLRYIPLLGPDLAWLYVGFRQAAYEAGVSRKPEKKFNAPSKKVARYAGMSLRAFWRWVARQDTWDRLRGLVTQVDSPVQWSRGKDGRPHQSARTYLVAMTLPLTPYDERSLRAWLYQQLAQGKTPLAVLEKALETSPDELIPWPEQELSKEKNHEEPHSIQEVIAAVCGSVPDSQSAQFQDMAEQLAQYLIPPNDLVFLTHYFVTHWLPKLGPGAGWLVTLLRDRGYINPRTGEIRDEVFLSGGYAEAADRLGSKRVKTIWEWLKSSAVTNFLQEIWRETGSWEDAPRRFKVCLGEPLTEADQKRAGQVLGIQYIGASGTHSEAGEVISVGASGIHNGGNGTHRPGAVGIHSGASGTHNGGNGTHSEAGEVKPIGASGIHSGASGTHSEDPVGADGIHNGGNGTHTHGANGTPVGGNGTPIGADDIHRHGASGTLDWREWHSFNSLTPGFKHPENTSTTSTGSSSFDDEVPNDPINKKVVGGGWILTDLLSLNRISTKNQELILGKGVTAQTFISWLLYAASQGGSGIREPIGHAVSRLIQDPSQGAGGVFERLAGLPANELIDLLTREMIGASPWNTDWGTAMADAPRTRLRALADQLGVPVPKVNDW